MNRAMTLRANLLGSAGCSFDAQIVADYGDKVYNFTMHCVTDSAGKLNFEVISPQTIGGITGYVEQQSGKLTFDDDVLAFETLVDGQIAPICAPWLMMHTLRSGYISDCSEDGDAIRIGIDDSYKEEPLRVDVWADVHNAPMRCEILWQGRRVLSVEVKNFTYL